MLSLKRVFQILFVVLATVTVIGQSGFTGNAPTFPDNNHIRYFIETDVRNPYDLTRLSRWLTSQNFDVAGTDWRQGRIEVITSAEGIQFLNAHGLKGEDLKAINPRGGRFTSGPDPKYLNPQSTVQKMQAINQAYPNLTHLEQIGTTLQGRPIMALLISDTPNVNDLRYYEKPSIIFDGEHHAREIMTPEIVMDVAEVMLKGFANNAQITQLVHDWNIWLVPMVNPDGSNIVFTKDSMWRKNARGNASSTFGVDINRNYTYRWAGCNGSSGSPSAQDYHGPSAGSEPETQALMNFAQKVQPAASLSYHSYSEFVLYPYGCNNTFTSEKTMIENIGKEMASRLPSDSGRGNYTPGTPWQLLYSVDGDSMDYMYASFGTLAFTFEVNQDFQPPYSKRDPTLAKHRGAWGYFLTRIDQNLLTMTVVDSKTNKVAPAMLAIDSIPHPNGELPFKTNAAGHYFKVLDPGHYVVTAKLQDGRMVQAQVQMNGQPQKVVLTVQ